MEEKMEPLEYNWMGVLTVKNLPQVVQLLKDRLTGRRFTFVTAIDTEDYRPKVRTDQMLKPSSSGDPFTFRFSEGPNSEFTSFHVCDTYGVWGFSTSAQEGDRNEPFKHPFFVFDYNTITMSFLSIAGNKIYWVVVVQRDPELPLPQ